jgi:glutamine synthetase
MSLPQGSNVIAEYIWIDGAQFMRSKCKTLTGIEKVNDIGELPKWNFDGSSCYMAPTENSEVILEPIAFYPDPFRGGNNIFVLCECYVW